MPTALLTGITGQDGSYLTRFLLSKGYDVHGIMRRASTFNTDRIDEIYQDPHESGTRLFLHYGDLTDGTGLRQILHRTLPDEVYNLAAQSHVRVSFDQPEYTADAVATGDVAPARQHSRLLRKRAPDGALLPGRLLGDVWRGGAAAERADAVLSAQPLRGQQGGGASVHGQLPRGLRAVPGERHPVQPRDRRCAAKPSSPARSRAPSGGSSGPAGQALPRQPGRQARLGLCRRLRRGHVADAAAGRSRTITSWPPARPIPCASFSKRRSRMSTSTGRTTSSIDPRYLRPTEVDYLLRRSCQGPRAAGLEAARELRGAGQDDGGADLELAKREKVLSDAGHIVAPRGMASY